MKVLIADDEPDILTSTQMVLEAEGYDATMINSPALVLEDARAQRPDVLLLDLHMPGVDVPLLIDALRRERDLESMRILLFTGDLEREERADELAVDGILAKPFGVHELHEALRTIFA